MVLVAVAVATVAERWSDKAIKHWLSYMFRFWTV